jgi:hypothetical protein
MDGFKTKHFIRCTPATDKPIVGAANQWNSHVIVHMRRHEKPDLHCLAKFKFCAGNLNLTSLE